MASAEEELPRLEVEFMEAVRRRDLPKPERMLGDGFVLTSGRPGAEVRTRREWLDVTRDAYLIESFRFEKDRDSARVTLREVTVEISAKDHFLRQCFVQEDEDRQVEDEK